MKITTSQIAKALVKTCGTLAPKDHPEAINTTITFMRSKGLGKEIAKLLTAFTKAWKAEHGILAAKLTSAKKEDENTVESLKKLIEKHFAKKIKLETLVDASLISGYVLQVEDKRIDTSLKTRLVDLATTLKNS